MRIQMILPVLAALGLAASTVNNPPAPPTVITTQPVAPPTVILR